MRRAQKHEARHEIVQAENQWHQAMLKANADAMSPLLSSDSVAITPDGALLSRDQILASLGGGAIHLTALRVFDRKVRLYGKTALVTSRAEVTGTSTGEDISGNYRYTCVYVRDTQGGWKIVSFEASRIREHGGHR
ncbi:MAG: nuclear transport factor 2 family protein [Terracidiphilus sp.]